MAIGSEADATRARLESAIDDSGDADINRQGPEMPRAAIESYLSNAARQRLAANYQLACVLWIAHRGRSTGASLADQKGER